MYWGLRFFFNFRKSIRRRGSILICKHEGSPPSKPTQKQALRKINRLVFFDRLVFRKCCFFGSGTPRSLALTSFSSVIFKIAILQLCWCFFVGGVFRGRVLPKTVFCLGGYLLSSETAGRYPALSLSAATALPCRSPLP